MSGSLRLMFLIILIAWITFGLVDLNKNIQLKQDSYNVIRATNQNALLDLQDDYNNFEELNTPAMIEAWLINFVNNNNIKWEDLTIGFVQIETEPPLYLIYIEGYKDKYALVKKDALIKFENGATIISDDE